MSANDKADDHRPSKGAGEPEQGAGGKRRRAAPAGELSKALRSVYDNTLREDVPDDFMDLLGKLS
ncbi:NepR family anti-sigma factor [Sphingomonas sp. BN140010]|uniref:NepR family anti-sigma factor n=1 Tax=Sphingomonas arvum TaxID=2992113 RepID=A0ABT3JGY5_9SPHN|nr:NepR family anti-sigma factor [Sphingomonas sp. BN140010]MCW3798353.1 NepR family anti-sigma factor [Sphingomonas sp. BN140010]